MTSKSSLRRKGWNHLIWIFYCFRQFRKEIFITCHTPPHQAIKWMTIKYLFLKYLKYCLRSSIKNINVAFNWIYARWRNIFNTQHVDFFINIWFRIMDQPWKESKGREKKRQTTKALFTLCKMFPLRDHYSKRNIDAKCMRRWRFSFDFSWHSE